MISDDSGPITKEKLMTYDGAAKEFLEIFETQSKGILPPYWRDLTDEQIINEAIKRLDAIERDILGAEYLKSHGLIQ